MMTAEYLGQCAGWYTAAKFLSFTRDEWVGKMIKNSKRTTPYAIGPAQIRAWEDCWDVLHTALSGLPEPFLRLHIIFEYVLPANRPRGQAPDPEYQIRADALVLSRKTVCVLEFKQRDRLYSGHLKAVRKYRKSLQRYHKESRGMNKKAILVLTGAKELAEQRYRAAVCSPDTLAQTLVRSFEQAPGARSAGAVRQWLDSPLALPHPAPAMQG